MIFGSACSGIEAASVAWGPLGWKAAWFSEIEPFPCAVLAHHYPETPNVGDMTTIKRRVLTGEIAAPDVFTAGTPCQAFSVAGLRRSLDDARGNLSLTFCEIADAIDHVRRVRGEPACIVVWENVPGVLSTADNAFGCFLAGLAGEDEPLQPPGAWWSNAGAVYGPARAVAWRTLDAQYFGLAQRRRRVFVVASARDDFDPAAVLFEWQGVRRDTAPSREAREGAAAGAGSGAAFGGNRTSGAREVASALSALSAHGGTGRHDFKTETFVAGTLCSSGKAAGSATQQDAENGLLVVHSLRAKHNLAHQGDADTLIAHSLRGEGFDASEDGTGRGTPLVPVAFDTTQITSAANRSNPQAGDPCHPLAAGAHAPAIAFAEPDYESGTFSEVEQAAPLTTSADRSRAAPLVAFSAKDHGGDATEDLSPTLRAIPHHASHANGGGQMAVAFQSATEFLPQSSRVYSDSEAAPTLQATGARNGNRAPQVQAAMQVRRLTPRECERLQGFPDDYTLIPWRGKQASECPDGPRYKALGNSWAVSVVQWIGARIDAHLVANERVAA